MTAIFALVALLSPRFKLVRLVQYFSLSVNLFPLLVRVWIVQFERLDWLTLVPSSSLEAADSNLRRVTLSFDEVIIGAAR